MEGDVRYAWRVDRTLKIQKVKSTVPGVDLNTFIGKTLMDVYKTYSLSHPVIRAHLEAIDGRPEYFLTGRPFSQETLLCMCVPWINDYGQVNGARAVAFEPSKDALESLKPFFPRMGKINQKILHPWKRGLGPPMKVAEDDTLTERQLEIVRMVCDELPSKQIADELSLSVRTVEDHRRRIMEKVGVKSQIGLYRYAIERGIVEV